MPSVVELAYTTAGGLIGAAAQNYFAKHQERRQARAAVLECVRQVEDTIENVRALTRQSNPRGVDISSIVGVAANLRDGTESGRALAKAVGALEAASLIAGVPNVAVDLYRRIARVALEARIMWLMADYTDAPTDSGTDLLNEAGALQLRAAALLSTALWHPWRFRIGIRSRIRPVEMALEALRETYGREHARRRHPGYYGRLFQVLDQDRDQPPRASD